MYYEEPFLCLMNQCPVLVVYEKFVKTGYNKLSTDKKTSVYFANASLGFSFTYKSLQSLQKV